MINKTSQIFFNLITEFDGLTQELDSLRQEEDQETNTTIQNNILLESYNTRTKRTKVLDEIISSSILEILLFNQNNNDK